MGGSSVVDQWNDEGVRMACLRAYSARRVQNAPHLLARIIDILGSSKKSKIALSSAVRAKNRYTELSTIAH